MNPLTDFSQILIGELLCSYVGRFLQRTFSFPVKILYNFDTVLYQFLEAGTSDITFMGRDQELKCLAFSLYPLLIFPLQMKTFKSDMFAYIIANIGVNRIFDSEQSNCLKFVKNISC